MSEKRVFLIVMDSVGIGEMPDAAKFGDEGSNTLQAASKSPYFFMPNFKKLGLFHIEGAPERLGSGVPFVGNCALMQERSMGKDTTIGHWEIAGIVSPEPMPVFPNGFPEELLRQLRDATGREFICNKPYSGTEVIKDYGDEMMKTGKMIIYTSGDSVLQLAAHEDIIPVEELYRYCEIARRLCTGAYQVGRVIARPFTGKPGAFIRTPRRHDFSVKPPSTTLLDDIIANGQDVIAVGKISDIFAGCGISKMVRTTNNDEGVEQTCGFMKEEFKGLCFTNLVDFDMLYGHRNDVDGYAKALSRLDSQLPLLLQNLKDQDLLIFTADHGCDPSTPSTDHSREYTPCVMYSPKMQGNHYIGTRKQFADIAATIAEYLSIDYSGAGESMLSAIREC